MITTVISLSSDEEESLKRIRDGSIKYLLNRWKNGSDEFKERFKSILANNTKKAHKGGKIKYNTFKGKKHSEETQVRMCETKKGQGNGESNSQFGTCWITNEVENKKIKRDYLIPEGFRLGRII